MEHAPAVGLILALALGLVSLALIARLPQRDAVPGLAWLPVTLLLYNLWVAGFLAAASFSPPMHRPTPPADGWTLTLLALAVAWVFAHVVQLEAFLGRAPSPIVRRAGLYTIAGVVILLLAARLLGALVKNDTIIGYCLAVLRLAVFPLALISSVRFFVRVRRLDDDAWRARLSPLAIAYAVLFAALLVLSFAWSRLALTFSELPIAADLVLEVLYNVVAIGWVVSLSRWLAARPASESPPVPGYDRARLYAEHGITKREAEIIDLVCQGQTNQEIADQLFISVTTVKDHNYVAYQKLGVRNRTELTRLVLGVRAPQPK